MGEPSDMKGQHEKKVPGESSSTADEAKNLVELFQDSPLAGLDIEFDESLLPWKEKPFLALSDQTKERLAEAMLTLCVDDPDKAIKAALTLFLEHHKSSGD